MKKVRPAQKGFTIVELVVVIAVIGILAAITTVSYNGFQAKARDAKRLNNVQIITDALQAYQLKVGSYPTASGNGSGGWETSSINPGQFLQTLKTSGYLPTVPVDPINTAGKEFYYYRYPAGNYGCDVSKGGYFVLGIKDMESSVRPSPQSPGWSCPTRNWQGEFDWVTGEFEK